MGYIVTALILLDLSSAFGIIEHIILVDIFSVWYGVYNIKLIYILSKL